MGQEPSQPLPAADAQAPGAPGVGCGGSRAPAGGGPERARCRKLSEHCSFSLGLDIAYCLNDDASTAHSVADGFETEYQDTLVCENVGQPDSLSPKLDGRTCVLDPILGLWATVSKDDVNFKEVEIDGGMYSGQVDPETGKPEGIGAFRSSECIMEGQWKAGKLHGRGKKSWQDGRRYVGEFKAGLFAGKGRMEWPHAKGFLVYEGSYQDDRKHGEGRLTWPSGRTYTGHWVNGRREGVGEDISPSGVRTSGRWLRNVYVGKFEQSPTDESSPSAHLSA